MIEFNGREVSLRGGSRRRHTKISDGNLTQIGLFLAIEQTILQYGLGAIVQHLEMRRVLCLLMFRNNHEVGPLNADGKCSCFIK